MYAHILTNEALTIYTNGKIYTAHHDHPRFENAVNALRTNVDFDTIIKLIAPAKAMETIASTDGTIAITNGTVTYNGTVLNGYAIDKLLELHTGEFDTTPLKNFIQRVLKNPSNRAVTDLYRFLEIGELPLMSDGRFIAYKNINNNWTDIRTGTVDNSVGKIIEMPRNQVNDNPNQTCSHGLHVCSQEYLAHFPGARCIAVAVDPADVVSIPVDYNTTKMRVCKYEVLEELPEQPNKKNYWDSPVYDLQKNTPEDEDEDEDEDGDGNEENKVDIPEGFIRNTGVRPDVDGRVEVLFNNGIRNDLYPASAWGWIKDPDDYLIAAWRPIEKTTPVEEPTPEPNVIS